MDAKIEICRVVSLLRNVTRAELGECERAIAGDDLDRGRRGIGMWATS